MVDLKVFLTVLDHYGLRQAETTHISGHLLISVLSEMYNTAKLQLLGPNMASRVVLNTNVDLLLNWLLNICDP